MIEFINIYGQRSCYQVEDISGLSLYESPKDGSAKMWIMFRGAGDDRSIEMNFPDLKRAESAYVAIRLEMQDVAGKGIVAIENSNGKPEMD